MSRFVGKIFFLATLTFCHPVKATDVTLLLDEAEAYILVQPNRTLSILDSVSGTDGISLDDYLRLKLLMARAAVQTNQLSLVLQATEELMLYQHSPFFFANITSIMSGLGIWLRKNNHLEAAQQSFQCALEYSHNTQQKIILNNSLGLVFRQKGDLITAENFFIDVRQLATAANRQESIAMADNNLGLVYLEKEAFMQAESSFRKALDRYQTVNHRGGHVSAALNLMFLFLLQGNQRGFEGLYLPSSRLTKDLGNESKSALLLWLETVYDFDQSGVLSELRKNRLLTAFDNLEDASMKVLVSKYLAKRVDLEIDYSAALDTAFERVWFSDVINCSWERNKIDK